MQKHHHNLVFPCCITIPPSPVELEPDANRINLSATNKFSEFWNDAVPCTVKSWLITTSPVTVNKPPNVEPPVLSNTKLLFTSALGAPDAPKVITPSTVFPVKDNNPLEPLDPLEPDVPSVPEEPLEPEVPSVPEEPEVPSVPLEPEEPEEPDLFHLFLKNH